MTPRMFITFFPAKYDDRYHIPESVAKQAVCTTASAAHRVRDIADKSVFQLSICVILGRCSKCVSLEQMYRNYDGMFSFAVLPILQW